ncbi:uncharacterized protein B0I36DRAFT_250426, partial [Microdochium trichocladiopsis]
IPVSPKRLRRFYEAVKFEEALSEACLKSPNSPGRVPSDPPPDRSYDPEGGFRFFINKLAHVCDIHRGGSTVTGIAVLQDFDGVRYFIGSNERSEIDLAKVEEFLRSLFRLLRGTRRHGEPLNSDPLFVSIFHHIINFNQPRIRKYLDWLTRQIPSCLSSLQRDFAQVSDTSEPDLRAFLVELQSLVTRFEDARVRDHVKGIRCCASIIEYVDAQRAKSMSGIILAMSRENTINPATTWCDLRHNMARLKAYNVSTKSIISAYNFWPELFQEDIHMEMVPSSRPHPNPLRRLDTTAAAMLGRMVADDAEIELRRAEAEQLKQFNLDGILHKACARKSFTPLVHGEVLVHDAARTYLLENPGVTYWKNWRFVGSSKPTCRLCSYYFSCINDVTVRESHRILYSRWRVPDVFDERAAKARDEILDSIAKKIRQDALQTMRSKLPQGRNNDSSSFPTVPRFFARAAIKSSQSSNRGVAPVVEFGHGSNSTSSYEHASEDLLVEMMERQTFTASFEDDEDDDDENGGVLLFSGRGSR